MYDDIQCDMTIERHLFKAHNDMVSFQPDNQCFVCSDVASCSMLHKHHVITLTMNKEENWKGHGAGTQEW